jgi:hypothetical protein
VLDGRAMADAGAPGMHALRCHPDTPTDAVRGVAVAVSRPAAGTLALAYRVDADVRRLRLPPREPPRLAHDLWHHTCCEAFVRADDGTAAYHEYNFAPSTAWGVFAFRAYRDGGPLRDAALDPRVAAEVDDAGFALSARLPLAALSPAYPVAALRLAAAVIVEETDGRMSYWALHHPRPQPDFHHAAGFALRVPEAA